MKLRTKFLIPIVLFSTIFSVLISYIWLPKVSTAIQERATQELDSHLKSVAGGLVTFLLQNQLATIHEEIDLLLEQNPHWKSARLTLADGTQIYPISQYTPPEDNKNLQHFQHPISILDNQLGKIEIIVDLSPVIDTSNQLIIDFTITFFLFLALFMLAISLIVEHIITGRIHMLSVSSGQIAQGNYDGNLPDSGADEIGALINDFKTMRNSLKEMAEHSLQEQKRLNYESSHDALTGLTNRREFDRRMQHLLERSEDDDSHVLLYIDLDQFKIINDTCGHNAGDELLRQIPALIEKHTRKSDTVARLGGDEFAVILISCNINQATHVAQYILDSLSHFKFQWHDTTLSIGGSIGIVEIADVSAYSLTDIMRCADSACYAAKIDGRNNIRVYKETDQSLQMNIDKVNWVARTQQALDENRLVLYAQPIVPTDNSSPLNTSYELLVRIIENGNLIMPNDFLPAAEQYKQIIDIDRWVVSRTLSMLIGRDKFLDSINHISINLSCKSLTNEDFMSFLTTHIGRSGLAEKICLEITETAMISNFSNATRSMSILHDMGIRFSLDDFGSGFSSFAYLKTLKVDYLKIDGLFIKNIARDPIDLAMVKSIQEVGSVMGKQTVAEFVENDEILSILADIGVNFAQGYGIGKPLPFEEILN